MAGAVFFGFSNEWNVCVKAKSHVFPVFLTVTCIPLKEIFLSNVISGMTEAPTVFPFGTVGTFSSQSAPISWNRSVPFRPYPMATAMVFFRCPGCSSAGISIEFSPD